MIRAVLFDLDGTLLDSAPDLVAALNVVRADQGLEAMDVSAMRHHVSRGAAGLLAAGMPKTDEVTLESWKQRFLDYYGENSFRHSHLFDEVDDVLQLLDRHAIPWGVVTNKVEQLTLPIMKQSGLISRAGCVICGDTLNVSKPHPAPVSLACELLGVEPGQAIMVGDDQRDLDAGQAAGTHTALAAYGYLPPAFDHNSVADSHVLHTPMGLWSILEPGTIQP